MSAPKIKSRSRKSSDGTTAQNVANNEVLTAAEAAAYLRIAEGELLGLVAEQGLPGRRIGAEWRFLRAALQDWLRASPLPGSKEAVLSVAGAWKDDPFLEDELKEIYRGRGRPMNGDG